MQQQQDEDGISHLQLVSAANSPQQHFIMQQQQSEPEPQLGIITQPILTQGSYSLPLSHDGQDGSTISIISTTAVSGIEYEMPITSAPLIITAGPDTISEDCSDGRNGININNNSDSSHQQGDITNLDTVVLAMKSSSTDPRKFVCHLCCRTVKSKQALDMHIRSHTGEKPYTCTDCGKNFSQQASLNRHRKGVHLPKTQECYECGRKFGYRDYLVKHIRIHTGERPYVCPKCDKRFRDKTSLNQHSKWHK